MKEFYENYISINLKDYSNIGIDLEITKVLFAFFIAIIVATIVINYNRACTALVIKRLLRREALNTESAKTLSELSATALGVKMLLKSNGRIKRIIKRVGETEYTYEEYLALGKKRKKNKGENTPETSVKSEEKIDFSTARFYLNSERLDEAKGIVERDRSSIINTVLLCLLVTAVFVCLVLLMPELLNLLNGALASK